MFIVYGKHTPTMKMFRPLDMKKMEFVINRIHASIFSEEELEELEKEVEYMNKHNKDYVFEIRCA